jgi:hypothetical protein
MNLKNLLTKNLKNLLTKLDIKNLLRKLDIKNLLRKLLKVIVIVLALKNKAIHKKILYVMWVLMIGSRKLFIGNCILYGILRLKIFMPNPFDYSDMVDEMRIFLILIMYIGLFLHIVYGLYWWLLFWAWN